MCLSETSSPCGTARDPIPNHTPSTKAQSKPPLLHNPWQVAPDRPPTLNRLGSLVPNLSSESDRLLRLRLQSPICTLQLDPGRPAPVARPVAVSACHSLSRPSREGACPRSTVHNVLTARGAALITTAAVHTARTHARGVGSEGLVNLQIKTCWTQIRSCGGQSRVKPACDGDRPPQPPPQSGSALEKLRAGTRKGNQHFHSESSNYGWPRPSRFLQVSDDQSPTIFNSLAPYFTTCISLMSEMRERCTRTPSLLGTCHPSGPGPLSPCGAPFSPLSLAVRNKRIVGEAPWESGSLALHYLAPDADRTSLLVPCTSECLDVAKMVLCNACYRHSHRSHRTPHGQVQRSSSLRTRGSWKSKRRPTVLHHQEQSPPRLSTGAGPRQHGMGSRLHVAGEWARTGRFPVISHPHQSPHSHELRFLICYLVIHHGISPYPVGRCR